jgi:putative transposase
MWVDVKTLAEIIGKSRRTIQLRIKKDSSIVTRLIDKKKIEILITSLPSEWQTLVIKKTKSTDIPIVALSTPAQLIVIQKTAVGIGSKIDEKQRKKMLIALKLDNKPSNITKGEWILQVAFYFSVSQSTVRRISKEHKAFNVIGRPKNKNRNQKWSKESIKYLQGYYLAALKQHGACNKKTAVNAVIKIANERSWPIGCQSSAYTILSDINPLLIAFATGGNRALDNYFWIARDCDALKPFQIVIGDQHIFDYWIADYDTGLIRRPECYLWLDMCTKLIYGIAFDKHYSSDTVRESLRLGLNRFGAFDCTYNDNGTSECSKAINLIVDDLLKLGMRTADISELYKTNENTFVIEDDNGEIIDVAASEYEWKRKHRRIFAGVKNAKAKDIERFFRTFEKMLDEKMVPGRCATPGASAAIDEVERARLEKQKAKHELLTEKEFIAVCIEILSEYEQLKHATLKMTPWEKLLEKQSKGWKAKFYDKLDINFALAERKICTVTRGRVVIDTIWYIGEEMKLKDGTLDDSGIYKFDGHKLEIRYNRHHRELAFAVTPNAEIKTLVQVNSKAITMLDDQSMVNAISEKRRQIKNVKEAFNTLIKPIGKVAYEKPILPEIKQAEKSSETEVEPIKLKTPDEVLKTVIRPFKSLMPTLRQRYQWCLEMLVQGAPLPEEDKGFIKEYKDTEEYEEYEMYFNSLEVKIGG